MRLGINILYLIPGEVGGTETYARNLITALSKELKEDDHLYLFVDREASPLFVGDNTRITVVTLPFLAKNRALRLMCEQLLLPIMSLYFHLDALFSLGYSQPLWLPCPSVVTIHDLNWYYHPEDFSHSSYLVWKWLTTWSARRATHVVTDSLASATSLKKILRLKASKVTPILHAAPREVVVSRSQIAESLRCYHLSKPYLMTVVAGYPHKNFATLLRAFARLHVKFPDFDLVVCGLGGRADDTNRRLIHELNLDGVVRILGYVTRPELVALYRRATVFVFPSAYEGFGYPVVEAMQYGTPVVSSNAFALKEVVADGGILVDPYDEAGYVRAITRLLRSSAARTHMIAAGHTRLTRLSWERTAQKSLQVIRQML